IITLNLGPEGATFNPTITLSVTFDPGEVPEGKVVVIKFFDGTEWVELETTVDLESNTATAKVSHFTFFGLFTKNTPVPKSPLSQGVGIPSKTYEEMPVAQEPAVVTTPTPETMNIGLVFAIAIAMVVMALGVYYFRRSEL
ncbi:MAG: hypothetical protein SVK08_07905, partial [Halobacteriota archaeon]|nr:hypothetical protein [Halobacteriota archaeon]